MHIIEKTYGLNGTLSIRAKTERIILHHADASNCTADDIDRWHKQKNYTCIGYHFFVRKDGSIYRGRKENSVGAHAYGSNHNSIGICFEGRYETEQMPDVQVEAGKELVAYLKNKYGISKVQKHSDVCNTSCPGRNFRFDEIANVQARGTDVITTNNDTKIDLKFVAKGKIADIQSILNSRYGFNIAVDNIYGPKTKQALVKALQTELNKQYNRGLSVDGIFRKSDKECLYICKKRCKRKYNLDFTSNISL